MTLTTILGWHVLVFIDLFILYIILYGIIGGTGELLAKITAGITKAYYQEKYAYLNKMANPSNSSLN